MERKNVRCYVTPFSIFWSIVIILCSAFFTGCGSKNVYVLYCVCNNETLENMEEKLEENGFAAIKGKWRGVDIFVMNTYTKLSRLREAKTYAEEVIGNVKFASLSVSDELIDDVCVIKNQHKKAMLRIKVKEMVLNLDRDIEKCRDCDKELYEGIKKAFLDFEKDFQTSSIDVLKRNLCASIGACLLQNFG